MRTDDTLITAQRIAEAVTVVVNECSDGAPSELIYGALSEYLTIDRFTELMRLLVETKRVRKHGGRYFPRGGSCCAPI